MKRIKRAISDIMIGRRKLNRKIINCKKAWDEINAFLNPKCK